jgi:hypothetical protein
LEDAGHVDEHDPATGVARGGGTRANKNIVKALERDACDPLAPQQDELVHRASKHLFDCGDVLKFLRLQEAKSKLLRHGLRLQSACPLMLTLLTSKQVLNALFRVPMMEIEKAQQIEDAVPCPSSSYYLVVRTCDPESRFDASPGNGELVEGAIKLLHGRLRLAVPPPPARVFDAVIEAIGHLEHVDR